MSSAKLLRAMYPNAGEEQVIEMRETGGRLSDDDAQSLLELLRARLAGDSTIAEVIVDPQIIRQRDVRGAAVVHVVTAIALVTRKSAAEQAITDYVYRSLNVRNKALETWAEKMLQDGKAGIAMIQSGEHTLFGLNHHVPFGHIYEFPSEESYLTWLNREMEK